MTEKILVAVAWPYANGSLHLGQIAGAYLPADIFARYHRLKGNDVLMVSGSDQHGTPITIKAEQEKKKPGEIAGRYHREFLESWQR
ncbi:MAG: methionine--tRNA ligase, partial [Dehalococcoidia bacterium]